MSILRIQLRHDAKSNPCHASAGERTKVVVEVVHSVWSGECKQGWHVVAFRLTGVEQNDGFWIKALRQDIDMNAASETKGAWLPRLSSVIVINRCVTFNDRTYRKILARLLS